VIEVLDRSRTGALGARPYRVKASARGRNPEPSAGFFSKLDVHVNIVLTELDKLDLMDKEKERKVFEELMSSYENLPEARRKEVQELSDLITSPLAKRLKERIAKDGSFGIRVAEDGMTVYLDVVPAEGIGKPVALHSVLEKLRDAGVVYGIDHVRIRRALEMVIEKGRPIHDFVVGEGTRPEKGADGSVEFFVKPMSKEQVAREDGSVDYHGKADIPIVRKGDLLARVVPAGAGKRGTDVRGKEVPPPPAEPPRQIAAGDGVSFDEKSLEYRAAVDGIAEIGEGKAIQVKQLLVIPGDVDMTTGNVEFDGQVRIAGSVRDSFAVRAKGDIEIDGAVEGCEVVSAAGSVKVRQGIAGRSRCFVSAGTDVEAKYIENARVYARGNVAVRVAIMHSEVVAGAQVLALGGKGAIVGGTTKAGLLIHAKVLGARNEPPTELVVGISMEQHDVIRRMDQKLMSLSNAQVHLDEVVKSFAHAERDASKLPPSERERLADLKMKLLLVHYEIDNLEAQRQKFVQQVTAQATGTVKVASEVFGRVTIRIGHLVDHVDSYLRSSSFRADLQTGAIIRDRYVPR